MHGLAVLAALGVTFTIKLFERATIETERVEAELRQSEQRFRALVQHASDIIMVIGPDANIRYVSPAFEAILGYSSVEAIGMSGARARASRRRRARCAPRSSVGSRPAPRRRRRGAALPSRRHVALVRRDRHRPHRKTRASAAGSRTSATSPSARRRKPRSTRRRKRSATRSTTRRSASAWSALDGRIQRANRSMAVLLGRTQEELAGTFILDLTHPDDREESDEHRERLTRSEIDFYRIEKRYLRPDGTTVWASLSVSLVRDMRGRADVPDRPARGHHRPQAPRRPARARRRARRDDRPAQPRELHRARVGRARGPRRPRRSRCCSSTSTTSRS